MNTSTCPKHRLETLCQSQRGTLIQVQVEHPSKFKPLLDEGMLCAGSMDMPPARWRGVVRKSEIFQALLLSHRSGLGSFAEARLILREKQPVRASSDDLLLPR